MPLSTKLQIKPGQQVVVLRCPAGLALDVVPASVSPESADAVVMFAASASDLSTPDGEAAVAAARRDALAWVAYPKAGGLGTDLNRDKLAALLRSRGIRPVRQVSIDDVWSALRFRPGSL